MSAEHSCEAAAAATGDAGHHRRRTRGCRQRGTGGAGTASSAWPWKQCHIHRPTLEELRAQSFSDYIRNTVLRAASRVVVDHGEDREGETSKDHGCVEATHEEKEEWSQTELPLSQGIAKVILPQGFWNESLSKGDRSGRGAPWHEGTILGDWEFPSPMQQTVNGMAGIYEFIFVDQPPITLSDFRIQADNYRTTQVGCAVDEGYRYEDFERNRPKKKKELAATPGEYGGDNYLDGEQDNERLAELERIFWKRIGATMPPALYGADLEGSLFGKDPASGWSLNQLDSCLHVLSNVPGVTSPYLYLGMWASCFATHTEDMNLLSVNYLHAGAPKIWYAVAPGPDSVRLEQLAGFHYAHERKKCKEFLRHKRCLMSPIILRKAGIPFTTVVQRPGEAVITFPGGYHFGFNSGFNLAEATNFGVPEWIPFGLRAKVCMCRPDSVRIDMEQFINIIQLYNSESKKKGRRQLSYKAWSLKRQKELKQDEEEEVTRPAMVEARVVLSSGAVVTKKISAKKALSEQKKKNEFWVEVMAPVSPNGSLPRKRQPKGKSKKTKQKKMAVVAELPVKQVDVWHLAQPIGRKGVTVGDRVLVILPATVMTARGYEGDDDEQCFAARVTEISDGHARLHFGNMLKSEDVWMAVTSPKLYLDGGQWTEQHEAKGMEPLQYWQEMDSKIRTENL